MLPPGILSAIFLGANFARGAVAALAFKAVNPDDK